MTRAALVRRSDLKRMAIKQIDFRRMQLQVQSGKITWIYFLWSESTGLFKVGKSADPERRRRELSSIMGTPLFLLFSFRAPEAAEKAIHSFLAPYRHSHEWFCGDEANQLAECFEDFSTSYPDDQALSAEDIESVFNDWLNSYGRGQSACGNNVDNSP